MAFVRQIGSLAGPSDVQALIAASPLVEELANKLHAEANRLATGHEANAASEKTSVSRWTGIRKKQLSLKFFDHMSEKLQFSSLESFFDGLMAKIGAPNPKVSEAMAAEHTHCDDSRVEFFAPSCRIHTTSDIEWDFVTRPDAGYDWPVEESDSMHEQERRVPMPLEEVTRLVALRNGMLAQREAALIELDEAFGARLYTGPMYTKRVARVRTLAEPEGPETSSERRRGRSPSFRE